MEETEVLDWDEDEVAVDEAAAADDCDDAVSLGPGDDDEQEQELQPEEVRRLCSPPKFRYYPC